MNPKELEDEIERTLSRKEKKILDDMMRQFMPFYTEVIERYLQLIEQSKLQDAEQYLTIPKLIFSIFNTIVEVCLTPITMKYGISDKKYNDIINYFLTLAMAPIINEYELSEKQLYREIINDKKYNELTIIPPHFCPNRILPHL
ncbi:MAG: hypothetical protein LBR53_12600 [Deltaproteobacteria bacterium]|jgi:hypothetical protein|nr:hypothetical protein [Deltaproteobacteria bacterium]